MPTPRFTLLTLLACSAVPTHAADTLAPDFGRLRPAAASIGPRSAPRLPDPAVEPASFQALAAAKPIDEAIAIEAAESSPPEIPQSIPPTSEQALREVTPAIGIERSAAPVEEPQYDPVKPARGPAQDDDNGRRLFGGSPRVETDTAKASAELADHPMQSLMAWRPSTQTLTATGGGLAVAVGLLIASVCLIRNCLPKSARALPREVVEVLGRAPLGGKQTTQLVRVGNKLVLIAVTPDGAETLTEITDPGEVARLVASCDAGAGRGANAEFDSMLREMSDERTQPGFLDTADRREEPLGFDPRSLAAAYANTPGGRGDG